MQRNHKSSKTAKSCCRLSGPMGRSTIDATPPLHSRAALSTVHRVCSIIDAALPSSQHSRSCTAVVIALIFSDMRITSIVAALSGLRCRCYADMAASFPQREQVAALSGLRCRCDARIKLGNKFKIGFRARITALALQQER